MGAEPCILRDANLASPLPGVRWNKSVCVYPASGLLGDFFFVFRKSKSDVCRHFS